MSKHIAVLSIAAALLGVAALPGGASAADLYGYGSYGGEDRPLALHSREDVYLDGGRAHVVRRDDVGPDGYGPRRGPGPVVYDERGRDPGGFREPGPRFGWGGEERPVAFAPPPPPPPYGYGEGWRGAPGFRPAAAFRGGPDFGEPEGGCTVERARTITPAGWEKTVTHRTCYRR